AVRQRPGVCRGRRRGGAADQRQRGLPARSVPGWKSDTWRRVMGEIIAIGAAALLWSFLNGALSWGNMLFGAVLGLVMLSVMERNVKRGLPQRLRAFLRYLLAFLREMVVSGFVNVRLALSPHPKFHPQIVQVPLT